MRNFALLVLVAVIGWSSGAWGATSWSVPGTSNIYLAGHPTTTTLFGDSVPANSPIAVQLDSIGNPGSLSFNVTGSSSRSPGVAVVGGDGEGTVVHIGAELGFGGASAPYSSLVGLFVESSASHPVPPHSNFSSVESRSFVSLSPSIQQVFFIGDGFSGTGAGERQSFSVPAGADTLYFATFDTGSWNNLGSLEVTLVPEPSTALLLGIGLAGLGMRRRQRTRRGL